MIMIPPDFDPDAPVTVIAIGNSRTALGIWTSGQVAAVVRVPTGDVGAFDEAFEELARSMPLGRPAAAVVSSVVPMALATVRARIEALIDRAALVIGEQVARPIDVCVPEPAKVGMDRLCNAAAAYERLEHSCVVVDFGTAVTVDLVDDDGVFQGGAILPGLRLQFAALHQHTAQLPEVPVEIPEDPVGRSTREAMQSGVCRGLCGAVRGLVEAYASKINHWPQTVATGGDAVLLAPYCDFLDNVVPDLCLRGVGLAYSRRIAGAHE